MIHIYLGEQFTWHYDAIQPHLIDASGNRMATLIVYLNDCESGGETAFRDLDLKVNSCICICINLGACVHM
jgi:hypothetical protein